MQLLNWLGRSTADPMEVKAADLITALLAAIEAKALALEMAMGMLDDAGLAYPAEWHDLTAPAQAKGDK